MQFREKKSLIGAVGDLNTNLGDPIGLHENEADITVSSNAGEQIGPPQAIMNLLNELSGW